MKGSLLQRTRRCGLSMVLLFCLASPSCRALRRFAPADHKAALDLHKLAASKDMTAYGRQVAGTYVRNTSVDHFGSAQYTRNNTFQMRYFLIWPENPPTAMFLFCGQESSLENSNVGAGFYSDLANDTEALQIWPEHRYYADTLRYRPSDNYEHFTIEQALVDHVELVLHLQNAYNMSRIPVITIGSSYSGQLSSYLRIRYPDVFAGAISSSPTSFGCPGLGLDPSYDLYGFAKVATRTASSEAGSAAACPANVQKFFKTIFSLATTRGGFQQINDGLNLCRNSTVASASDVTALAQFVQSQWQSAAQYNAPTPDLGGLGIPAYRVRVGCNYLADANISTTKLLSGMGAALGVFNGIQGQCLQLGGSGGGFDKFGYQVCNQDQTPISSDGVNDMFFNSSYSLDDNDQECVEEYGIHAQYNWAAYSFGLSAIRQSSNIFFTNGFYDPFIACGPTIDISDTITTAVYEGCHAYDVGSPDPADPPSVTSARDEGATLITKWIDEHNIEAKQIPKSNAANLFELAYSLGGYTQDVNDTLPGNGFHRTQAVASGTARYSNGNSVV